MHDGSEANPAAGSRRPRPSRETVPAIVLGHSETSLAVMRLLGRRGIPSYLASLGRSFVSVSRWYRPCPGATGRGPAPGELASFLDGLPFERAVLMPCADDWVRAVVALPPALRERFPASVAEPATIDVLLDKARLGVELERFGLPHPATVVVSSPQDLEALPDSVVENAFLKPRDSLSFYRRYGTKGFRVRDKADALARLADVVREGHTMVLQEFIPGSAEDHFFVEGFMDRAGRVCARSGRQRLRMWPPDFGGSAYTRSVPLETVAPASTTLDRLFAHLPYRGIFAAEFMRDRRSDEFRLLEVNVRPFVHIEFIARCGADLAWMAYRDALDLPVEPVLEYEVGRRCHDLDRDWPAAHELIRQGKLRRIEWIRSYLGADGLVFARDDPLPGLYRLHDTVPRELRAKASGARAR